MLTELQSEYESLGQRVGTLELDELRTDFAELSQRVTMLESHSEFNPAHLRFVGGYRIPVAMDGAKSMAFTHGGLTGRHESDGRLRLWMTHHATSPALAEFIAPTLRSMDLTATKSWPIAEHVRNIPGVNSELYAIDNACQLHGVYWSEERNRLLASGRSWYNTTGGKDAWLMSIDVATNPPMLEPRITPGLSHQAFGGGFVDIPTAFADEYCNGNTIGLGLGGYESGQASATSPTLAAWGSGSVKVLMHCKWNAPKERRENRDADYDPGGIGWQPAPENGVGYFGVDRVQVNAWIKTNTVDAFIAIVLQPTGKLDYSLQGDVFSNTKKYTMYVYDPADLAKVATGELSEEMVRGKYYPMPIESGYLTRPIGLWWDKSRELLSIVYSRAWTPGGPEWYPVIAEYRIGAS